MFVRRIPQITDTPIKCGIENLFPQTLVDKIREQKKGLIKKKTDEDENQTEIESYYVKKMIR